MIAVAVLRTIDAAALFAFGLAVRDLPLGSLPLLASNPEVTRVVAIVFSALAIIGVVGLLSFQRWGWVLTMLLVGVSLAADLIRVALGAPPYLSLLLHVVTAFYLNGRAVRVLAHATPADDAGSAPRLDDPPPTPAVPGEAT
jgi:hypothetical protein